MAVWSVVNYADFHEGLDFDPEHYHPDRAAAFTALSAHNSGTLGHYFYEVLDIREGGRLGQTFDTNSAQSNFLIFDGGNGGASARKLAEPGDIIISRLRSYLRQVCLIPGRTPDFHPHLSTEFYVLRPVAPNCEWILAFLLSEQVQTVLQWSQTGSNHPRFPIRALRNLPVSQAVLDVAGKAAALVRDANSQYEQSATFYPEAEAELLERLCWEDLDAAPKELFYTENFADLADARRCDPEFFQPQYARLKHRIQERGGMSLGDLCGPITRGVQPRLSPDGGVLALDSKSVRPQGVQPAKDERVSRTFYDLPANASAHVQFGDVLLNSTGRGTLGRAACYQQEEPALCDNHVAILRPVSEQCLPVYLSLFLNSLAGIAQSEQYQTGSSGQLEIYPSHIAQFQVFVPRNKDDSIDLAWQQSLVDKVQEAGIAKTKAREKLDEAKRLIEQALTPS